MQRIRKIDVMRGAAIALLAAFALSACTTDPSPRTYLDWHTTDSSYRASDSEHHPVAQHANWPSATYFTVVVRPGDRVASIAKRYDVSESAVRHLNHIGPNDGIHSGDVLRIPTASEHTRDTVLSEVQSPRVYAQPHGSDYVEEHPLDAPRAPVRIARAEPASRMSAPQAEPVSREYDSISPPSDAMHFAWPVEGHVVLSYGASSNGERNDGINIAASEGAPIRAAAAGTVTYAGNELRQYGNLIIIKHADGYITVYAHEASIGVKKGDEVMQGQTIGTAGATGNVDRPELHFEVRYQTKPVNPRPLLSQTVARAAS